METVRICDVTMKQTGRDFSLSFREKIELAKMMDRMGATVIELGGIEQTKIDSLLVKSVASAIKDSILAVPVKLDAESVKVTWNAVKEAKKARLQVCAPTSAVQMEYLYHKKPQAMLAAVEATVKACREYTENVEFIADDATRSDEAFVAQIITTAIDAGAKVITVCDAAGNMLPEEYGNFVAKLYEAVPALKDATLGVGCSDALSMADACAVAAVRNGAREIKAASYRIDGISLPNVVRVLAAKGGAFGVTCPVRTAELKRVTNQICTLCHAPSGKAPTFDAGMREHDDSNVLTAHDSMEAVEKSVAALGYDLSSEDMDKVYKAFMTAAQKKDEVSMRELDAIVAAEAMQVPAAYQVQSYVFNSGNDISAMAHMKLTFHDEPIEGIALGDGPIDASFQAIEKTTGRHFELDDFQIQAMTEGQEALGQTVVKLRADGKIYSGRGISTDIVGASIMAYINALNKIVYEEEEA